MNSEQFNATEDSNVIDCSPFDEEREASEMSAWLDRFFVHEAGGGVTAGDHLDADGIPLFGEWDEVDEQIAKEMRKMSLSRPPEPPSGGEPAPAPEPPADGVTPARKAFIAALVEMAQKANPYHQRSGVDGGRFTSKEGEDATSGLSQALQDELEPFLESSRFDDDGEAIDVTDGMIEQAMQDAEDVGVPHDLLKEIRQWQIDKGIYREVTQEELDSTVVTSGKKYDFKMGGKFYTFEKHLYGDDLSELVADYTSVGRSAVSGPLAAHEIKELHRLIFEKGGFTYGVMDHTSPKTGFMVSPFPERSFGIDAGDFKAEHLARYVNDNLDLLGDKDKYYGGWLTNKGRIFLDVSIIKQSREEAIQTAIEMDQISIFDLATGLEILVNDKAKSGGAATKSLVEFLDDLITQKANPYQQLSGRDGGQFTTKEGVGAPPAPKPKTAKKPRTPIVDGPAVREIGKDPKDRVEAIYMIENLQKEADEAKRRADAITGFDPESQRRYDALRSIEDRAHFRIGQLREKVREFDFKHLEQAKIVAEQDRKALLKEEYKRLQDENDKLWAEAQNKEPDPRLLVREVVRDLNEKFEANRKRQIEILAQGGGPTPDPDPWGEKAEVAAGVAAAEMQVVADEAQKLKEHNDAVIRAVVAQQNEMHSIGRADTPDGTADVAKENMMFDLANMARDHVKGGPGFETLAQEAGIEAQAHREAVFDAARADNSLWAAFEAAKIRRDEYAKDPAADIEQMRKLQDDVDRAEKEHDANAILHKEAIAKRDKARDKQRILEAVVQRINDDKALRERMAQGAEEVRISQIGHTVSKRYPDEAPIAINQEGIDSDGWLIGSDVGPTIHSPLSATKNHPWLGSEDVLAALTDEATVPDTARQIGGGHVNAAYVVKTESGKILFVKPAGTLSKQTYREGINPGGDLQRELAAQAVNEALGGLLAFPATAARPDVDIGSGPEIALVSQFVKMESGHLDNIDYNGIDSTDKGSQEVDAAAFDFIIGNLDRHVKQGGYTKEGTLVLLDHGLAFPTKGEFGTNQGNTLLIDAAAGSRASDEMIRGIEDTLTVGGWGVLRNKLKKLQPRGTTAAEWSRAVNKVKKRMDDLRKHGYRIPGPQGYKKPYGWR